MEYIKRKKYTRKIQWIVDITGNSGKSTLTKCLSLNPEFNCLAVSVDYRRAFRHGLAIDLKAFIDKHGVEPSALIIDVPRDEETQYLHDIYGVLEEFHNGDIRSVFGASRFNFKIKMCIPIIIFSNSPPNFGALSSDRWQIKGLYKTLEGDDVFIQNADVKSKLCEWTSNFVRWHNYLETLHFKPGPRPLNFMDQLLFNMYMKNKLAMEKDKEENENEWLKDMKMIQPIIPGIISFKGPSQSASMYKAPKYIREQAIKKQHYAAKAKNNENNNNSDA